MRSFLHQVLSDFVAAIAVLGLTALVGILGRLQAIPRYQLALGVIFAFGGSLLLVNQLRHWWYTRRIKDNIWLSDVISKWLLDADLSVSKVKDTDSYFHYKVEDSGKRSFSILRSRVKSDDIRLLFRLSLAKEQEQLISTLDNDEQRQMIENIRIEVARLGVMYSGILLPLKEIKINTLIPLDIQFDRFKVIQHALLMIRTAVLITEHINHAARLAEKVK